MYYTVPEVGHLVRWNDAGPATSLRFTPTSVALLHHLPEVDDVATRAWVADVATVGVATPLSGLPVLAAQLGTWGAVAVPACIFELPSQRARRQWLRGNSTKEPAALDLVLLAPASSVGVARVTAVRPLSRMGPVLDELRERLHEQHRDYSRAEAGLVQAAGRQLLRDNAAAVLLLNSSVAATGKTRVGAGG